MVDGLGFRASDFGFSAWGWRASPRRLCTGKGAEVTLLMVTIAGGMHGVKRRQEILTAKERRERKRREKREEREREMRLTTNNANLREWERGRSQFCTEANEGNKGEGGSGVPPLFAGERV